MSHAASFDDFRPRLPWSFRRLAGRHVAARCAAAFATSIGAGQGIPYDIDSGLRVEVLSFGAVERIVAGDLDADGIVDLVSLAADRVTLRAFVGLGGGRFAPPLEYTLPGLSDSIALADVDDRPGVDILAGCGDLDTVCRIAFIDGRFTPLDDVPIPAGPVGIAAGDIDLDGIPDLAVVTGVPRQLEIHLGQSGGGTRLAQTTPTDRAALTIEITDLSGDGRPDVVLVTDDGFRVHRSLPAGAGNLVEPGIWYPGDGHARRMAIVDLDGDGDRDVARCGQEFTDDVFQVWANHGEGTFTLDSEVRGLTLSSTSVALTDENEDGLIDLVLGRAADDPQTVIMLNGGELAFTPIRKSAAIIAAWELIMSDIDGDGVDDVVSTAGPMIWRRRASGSLRLPTVTPTVDEPASDVTVLDVDEDGRRDLVISTLDGLHLARQRGDGGFGRTEGPSGSRFRGTPATGDVDGDGQVEIVARTSSLNRVRVQSWNGDGFALEQDFATEEFSSGDSTRSTVADFDGDGYADLLIAGFNRPIATVRFGGPDEFGPPLALEITDPVWNVAAGDLDGDGQVEVILLPRADEVVVQRSIAGRRFERTAYPVDGNPFTAVIADANLDGRLDLILGVFDDAAQPRVITLVGSERNPFSGATVSAVRILHPTFPFDINRDGRLDLVSAGGFFVALGTGPGRFEDWIRTDNANPVLESTIVADVDRDGDAEIVFVASSDGSILTVDGLGGTCFADVDGDGALALGDLLIILGDWGPRPGSRGDIDRDGQVGLLDLLTLLSVWGRCD